MLTGVFLAGLLAAAFLPLAFSFGDEAAEEADDDDIDEIATDDTPADQGALDDLLDESEFYEFTGQSGTQTLAGFEPGKDSVCVYLDSWDIDLSQVTGGEAGPELHFGSDPDATILKFPGLDDLPVGDISVSVFEHGAENTVVALSDVLAEETSMAGILDPVDPDVPDLPPDPLADVTDVLPTDPDMPDSLPQDPSAGPALDPVPEDELLVEPTNAEIEAILENVFSGLYAPGDDLVFDRFAAAGPAQDTAPLEGEHTASGQTAPELAAADPEAVRDEEQVTLADAPPDSDAEASTDGSAPPDAEPDGVLDAIAALIAGQQSDAGPDAVAGEAGGDAVPAAPDPAPEAPQADAGADQGPASDDSADASIGDDEGEEDDEDDDEDDEDEDDEEDDDEDDDRDEAVPVRPTHKLRLRPKTFWKKPAPVISDFVPGEDVLGVKITNPKIWKSGPLTVEPSADGEDAEVWLGDRLVAIIAGAPEADIDDIVIQAKGKWTW